MRPRLRLAAALLLLWAPIVRAADLAAPSAKWRPTPIQMAAAFQDHLEAIAPLLPSLARPDALVLSAAGLEPQAAQVRLELLQTLKDPQRLAAVKQYLSSVEKPEERERAQTLIGQLERLSAVLQKSPQALGSIEAADAQIRARFDHAALLGGEPTTVLAPAGTQGSSTLSPYRQSPAHPLAVAPPAPAAQIAGLPFATKRALPLTRGIGPAFGADASEASFRAASPEALFEGGPARRMDTLLYRQAAEKAQAMLEVIANAQDAGVAGDRKVGRFGVGGMQVLGELKDPSDRVVMETSKGDGTAAQFIFWKSAGEVFYDYRLIDSPRKGTRFQVMKRLSPDEIARRKDFLQRKLRANDRGPLVWKQSGERINKPETFSEWGADRRRAPESAEVAVSLDETGYAIEDSGKGMGLKEVFQRYLKPYNSDKPVAANADPARLFSGDAAAPAVSLGVTSVEIEHSALPLAAGRLNLAGDVFIDLPHDTDLTEDRGVISLVNADQSINGALRGLRLMIDRLTDPKAEGASRFALINSLAALIREKQPAQEKGLSRGDERTATDLMWYLRRRLERSGLLERERGRGTAFLPNSPRWSALAGLSDKIVFLDESLFAPRPEDFVKAGFEPLPPALTKRADWQALAARTKAPFYMRALRRDGPVAIVDDSVVVIEKGLVAGTKDPEVLIARIRREMRESADAGKEKPKPRRWSAWRRAALPLTLAAVLWSGYSVHQHWNSFWAPSQEQQQTVEWSDFESDRAELLGNPMPLPNGPETQSAAKKPTHQFGSYTTSADIDSFFVESIKSKLLSDGRWSWQDASWTVDPLRGSGSIDVMYRIRLHAGVGQRLLDKPNGRISGVRLEDASGNLLPSKYDERTDELTVTQDESAVVRYHIDLAPQVNDIDGSQPLPQNELDGFPAQWRAELDPLKNAPDAQKQAAIERIMARDFAYDYAKPFAFDGRSWGHTAQPYLDRHERVPIICNTSSLYYYIMARYLGLPAAYVGLVDSQDGGFYHDLFGHARAAVKVDGRWQVVETTSFMPTISTPPRVLSMPERRGPGWAWGRGWFKSAPDLPPWFPYALFGTCIATLVGLALWKIKELVRFVKSAATAPLRWWRLRSSLRALRASWRAFGGWRRRVPLAWLRWRGLAPNGYGLMFREKTAGGALYWTHGAPKRLYVANDRGAWHALERTPGERAHVDGGLVTYIENANIRVFDGEKTRTIFRNYLSANSTLIKPMGPRRYAVINKSFVRLDPKEASYSTLLKLGGKFLKDEIIPISSEGGIDRFATVRRAGRKKTALRSFTVTGEGARWDGPEVVVSAAWRRGAGELSAWPAGGRVVYEVRPKSWSARDVAAMAVSDSGQVPYFDSKRQVQAVIGDKVFVSEKGSLIAYDAATAAWESAVLGGVELAAIKKVGEDLFFVEPAGRDHETIFTPDEDGSLSPAAPRAASEAEASPYFCDSDGAPIVKVLRRDTRRPVKAVRHGDSVYYKSDEGYFLAASPSGTEILSLGFIGEHLRSRQLAKATGADASVFTPFDKAEEAVHYHLLREQDPDALSAAVEGDRAFIERLEPGLRAAAPFRAAMMPQWSPARLFLSLEATGTSSLSAETLARLDDLVRKNVARPDWLGQVFEPINLIARTGAGTKIVDHYLDIIAAAPELLDTMRGALLEPVRLASGGVAQPLSFVNEQRIDKAPPETQFYLRMLMDGLESLLRRESEDAPAQAPVFSLVNGGESLSRLIAAARKLSNEQIDDSGLAGFQTAYAGLASGERADLNSIKGVVVNQGLSAPVWLRELVQNARDAVREARRLGKAAASKIALRSYLSEDGSRWIVSVRDGAGMKLSRLLRAMLIPEATTKTLADEVRSQLERGGSVDEKLERLLGEFFDDGARGDKALTDFLKEAVTRNASEASSLIAERLSERMKKNGAGFFGIGFFTVFGGADEVVVRTGLDGKLHEAVLAPVRDAQGKLVDILVKSLRAYDDPIAARKGTEVQRIKRVTPENLGRVLIENAYLNIMARKYVGAVSDVELSLNGQEMTEELATAHEKDGVRSRVGRSMTARWTVDELFVSEPPAQGLAFIPLQLRAALLGAGWNLDFPAATPVVRTRASVQDPGRYAEAAASAALRAAWDLYRRGWRLIPGGASWAESRRVSPWDQPAAAPDLARDARAVAAGEGGAELWRRYKDDAGAWTRLMRAVCDDHETGLRRILGPNLCAELDALRGRGASLRVGPLPAEGTPDYETQVRALHEAAAAKARAGETEFSDEPAVAGLRQVLGRLSAFLPDAPALVPATAELCAAAQLLLNEGAAVPLMEALLKAGGRTSDAAAVRVFEGWLKSGAAKKELQSRFLQNVSRGAASQSLSKLWKAAQRGRPVMISLERKP